MEVLNKRLIRVLAVVSIVLNLSESFHTYEKLSVTQNNHLRFSFAIAKQHLPLPLREIPQLHNTQLSLHFSTNINYLQSTPSNTPGISFLLKNQSASPIFPAALKQIISATFAIAVNDRFVIHLQESKQFYYSSPNDKFCVQHLEEIIRNILPCRNYAGIGVLLDSGTLFSGKRGMEMSVVWDGEGMEVELVISPIIVYGKRKGKVSEQNVRQVKYTGIKRVKIADRCQPYFSEFSITLFGGQELPQNDIVLDRLQAEHPLLAPRNYENKPQTQQSMMIRKQVNGIWYSKHKQLTYQIKMPMQRVNKVTIRELLPPSCSVESVRLLYENEEEEIEFMGDHFCEELQFEKLNEYNRNQLAIEEKHGPFYVYPQFCAIPLSISNHSSPLHFIVEMDLKCKLIPFDQYETIYGGGQQLSQIPIALIASGQVSYIDVPRVTLRVPMPDEGIPFVIMTLTLIVLAYMYLALWKNIKFRKQEQNKKFVKQKLQ